MVSRAGLEPATTALKVQIGYFSVHGDVLFSVTYRLTGSHREPPKDKKVAKSDAKSNLHFISTVPARSKPDPAHLLPRAQA